MSSDDQCDTEAAEAAMAERKTKVHVYRESREDRNKRIAIEAIAIATRAVQVLVRAQQGQASLEDVAAELDAFHTRWAARDVPWTKGGQLELDPDAWVTAAELGAYLDKAPATIRAWHYRGHISSTRAWDGTPLYQVGEVVAYEAQRRVKPAS